VKQFGPFTLDTVNERLWQAGEEIPLPPKPFAVLRHLVENPGRLVSHDELLDALWPETYVQPQVLRTYMLDLRKVLDDDPRNPRFIQSLPKRGYCFVAEVCDVAQGGAAAHGAESPRHERAARPVSGRDRELASLHACLRRAAAGIRQVVFVSGEAGIGKSALVDAFRQQVESAQSAVVALGQCISGFAAKQEYYPLCDALREMSDSPRAAAVCRTLSHDAATTPAAPMPGELCAALEQIPGERPLLVFLEDLQWADESTVNVLSALARRRGQARLMIVATLAPLTGSAAPALTRLMQDLGMRRLCCELALPRLTRPAVAGLIRAHLHQDVLPQGLHEIVHQYSEGNPRFALTMLDHLIAEGILARASASHSWELQCSIEQVEAVMPGELARAIELEIEHLAPREQQLLEAGSLLPIAFPAWLVAAALGQDMASVEEACDGLARRVSFLKRVSEEELPDGTCCSFYAFAHALYREVLYRRQSPARRAARHIRISERLLAMFRGREELVAREASSHYEAAGDWTNAVAMLRIAARHALEMRAFGEAAELEHHIARIGADLSLAGRHAARIEAHQGLILPASLADSDRGRSTPPKLDDFSTRA